MPVWIQVGTAANAACTLAVRGPIPTVAATAAPAAMAPTAAKIGATTLVGAKVAEMPAPAAAEAPAPALAAPAPEPEAPAAEPSDPEAAVEPDPERAALPPPPLAPAFAVRRGAGEGAAPVEGGGEGELPKIPLALADRDPVPVALAAAGTFALPMLAVADPLAFAERVAAFVGAAVGAALGCVWAVMFSAPRGGHGVDVDASRRCRPGLDWAGVPDRAGGPSYARGVGGIGGSEGSGGGGDVESGSGVTERGGRRMMATTATITTIRRAIAITA